LWIDGMMGCLNVSLVAVHLLPQGLAFHASMYYTQLKQKYQKELNKPALAFPIH
jgi:hypothetical protein